jgi:hypothetical protein
MAGMVSTRPESLRCLRSARAGRAVVGPAVAEIAGAHDAEGTDGRQRADLGAAQPDVAVSCPDALAFNAARQLEVACEHVAGIERLAWIGQPSAAALTQLATTIVAVARVIRPTRIEFIHTDLLRACPAQAGHSETESRLG